MRMGRQNDRRPSSKPAVEHQLAEADELGRAQVVRPALRLPGLDEEAAVLREGVARAERAPVDAHVADLRETGPLSQGVQAGRKALRIYKRYGSA